jgi:acetyltransferase
VNTTQSSAGHLPAEPHSTVRLRDGTDITIRPVQSEDEPAFVLLHQGLSDQTVRFRYHRPLPLETRIAHSRLMHVCCTDRDKEIVLVAEYPVPGKAAELIGVARLTRIQNGDDSEFSVVVADRWQRRGLGGALLDAIVQAARLAHIHRILAHFEHDNRIVRLLCESRDFTIHMVDGDALTAAVLEVT